MGHEDTCTVYGVPLTLQCSSSLLGSFGAIVSSWSVTRKWLAIERNGLNLHLGGSSKI